MNNTEMHKSATGKFFSVVGIVLCIIFGFLLVCNITIIIKGELHPEKPPSVFGTTPMVVLSGSMSGDAEDHIEPGDLIFIGKAEAEELEKGDIIAFMENDVMITHRITEISKDDKGELVFTTKGDANNAADQNPVPAENLVGIYKWRIPEVGNFALFLHKPVGMLIFIGIPIVLFIVYDIMRRRKMAKHNEKLTADMEAEIERLRGLAESEQNSNSVTK